MNGTLAGSTKYYPYGDSRNSTGDLATDKLFTGQRLDDTGLYYYGARYYDPTIGRFISPDPFVQLSNGLDFVSYQLTVNTIPLGLGSVGNLQVMYPQAVLAVPMNPQALNRYSYVLNNPLKYTDPTGYYDFKKAVAGALIIVAVELPVVVFGVLTFFQPELIPAFLSFVPYYELVTAPAVALGSYLIIQGLSDTKDSNTPQLPLSEPEPLPTTAPEPTNPPVTITSPENSVGSGGWDDWYWWYYPPVTTNEPESAPTTPSTSPESATTTADSSTSIVSGGWDDWWYGW
jgi:RHS repeat-associated protein